MGQISIATHSFSILNALLIFENHIWDLLHFCFVLTQRYNKKFSWQELDDICTLNNWKLPTYCVRAADGKILKFDRWFCKLRLLCLVLSLWTTVTSLMDMCCPPNVTNILDMCLQFSCACDSPIIFFLGYVSHISWTLNFQNFILLRNNVMFMCKRKNNYKKETKWKFIIIKVRYERC